VVLRNIFIHWHAVVGRRIGLVRLCRRRVFRPRYYFFWPTTLAFVSENLPQSGAFGLSIMGGLGTLSVSVIMPIMGRVLDNAVGMEAIQTISILPGIVFVLYGGLFFLRRSKAKTAPSI
jgi:hypothetical protein